MPMGIVSDAEFDREKDNVSHSREVSNTVPGTTTIIEKGRGHAPQVPDSLRKVIGDTAVTDGPAEARALARNFGISPSAASAYAVGANSTATYSERPNAPVINGAKERIAKRARGKLMLALSHITGEKLQDAKPRDLAGIAKDMSVVAKNMEGEQTSPNNNGSGGPTFNFYAPVFRKEETYEVVYAKD